MAGEGPASVPVWDRPVRLLHWSVALACAAAWATSEILVRWHEPAGYVATALVAVRLVWGFVGGPYARFVQFVRGPRETLKYAGGVLRGDASRYLGHNPLGAWMALAFWLCIAGLGFTGWLYTTDAFWGAAWLDRLHGALAWALAALVVFHLIGVVHTGCKHGERLVTAMFTGRKRPPSPGDIG